MLSTQLVDNIRIATYTTNLYAAGQQPGKSGIIAAIYYQEESDRCLL